MNIVDINNIYKAIPKKNKSISLYLDWLNSSSYVGEGKIIEMIDYKKIIFFDNPLIKNKFIYFRPRRCLCEIISSDNYPKGFRKHFVIPFRISEKIANKILLIEEKKINKIKNHNNGNIISNILEYNNSLTDTFDEINLQQEVLMLYKKNKIKEKFEEIKEKLRINLEKRQKDIDNIFDKLYPEKAKRIAKKRKR